MTPDLKTFFSGLAESGTRAKVAAGLVVLALAGVFAIGGYVASQPHMVLLYSQLSDADSAAIQKALAEQDVRFRVSQPPAPYVIHVDESQYYEGLNAVASAGALDRAPTGINPGQEGASKIFMGSAERAQIALKKAWQEMERMLEALDFVASADVTTSTPDASPLRNQRPVTVSAVLRLRGTSQLSDAQQRAVANLARFCFGVPPENLVILDQDGVSLHDPSLKEEDGMDARSLLEHSVRYDRELARMANEALGVAFGPDKAYVTVHSEWNYDQTTRIEEMVDPKNKVVRTEESSTSKTPLGTTPAVGGPVGTTGNLADGSFGIDNAGFGSTPAAGGQTASTSEDKKSYDTSRYATHEVHTAPSLQRLSISLFIDESLAERQTELENIVKAAVGFIDDETRTDQLHSLVHPLATAQPVEETAVDPGQTGTPSAPNPMLEMLLERGVEIVAAIGFLVLLLRSLRSSKTPEPGAPGSPQAAEAEVDLERLAQAQVEELIKSDPERVSEILSRWAGEERELSRAER